MTSQIIKPDYIFEASWEVCNKVGGIYTVLSTRAKTLNRLYGDQVIYIGPDLWEMNDNPDFIESKTLLKTWLKQAREKEGLQVRVGRWNIPGKPIAILVKSYPYYEKKDDIYYRMWEDCGVDSSSAHGDYDESCMFAYATGKVIESLYSFLKLEDKKVIAHMNEWMLSMGILYLRDKVPAIATIFTTHATSIGRSIAGNNKPLYDQFYNYNGDQMARELNMMAKHSVEKQAAHYSDCFTTVSEITAKECEQLLEKNPDIITPNGFEDNFVPKGKKYDEKRMIARQALIKVAENLMGETVSEDTLFLAISGRYEFKNKGIDVFIEAMNRVRLDNPEKQIIAYILVPAWINGPRVDLQNRLATEELADHPLYHPYYTHNLVDIDHDKVCEYLQYLNFINQKEHNAKLIFVPSYLMGDDGIFNLSYYDLLIGMDLTVFPSYYEPWGYTPLESIAFHVPTITTNLAGFGIWAREQEKDLLEECVTVVRRTDHNYFEVAEEIKKLIINYSQQNTETVEETRKSALLLSKYASWEHFIQYYQKAYTIALENSEQRNKQK